jgi:site-specific DNA-methyltransferase (adenine-specific)
LIRDGIYEADALEFLRDLPDASVDLVVTDPPYFRVKGEPWDRQWDSAGAFLDWIGELSAEWARVLKPNGSLYVFASPRMAARVEVTVGQHLNVLNRIRWLKSQGWHRKARKEELRSYLSPWEEIVFAEHYGADSAALGESGYVGACDRLRGFVFESIRAYLDGERRRAGIDKADCNVACGFSHSAGGMASRHYFSQSQWCLPTEQHYAALRRLFNERGRRPAPPYRDYHPADGYFAKVLRADYEYLRADYEYLRAD